MITGVIFTCPGPVGPGRFLGLIAAALVYFAIIAIGATQPYHSHITAQNHDLRIAVLFIFVFL